MSTGEDLGGLGGRSPQNLRWGTAHASVPPIFRELLLLECEAKYKKCSFLVSSYFALYPITGILGSEIEVLVKKRVNCHVSDSDSQVSAHANE